MRLLGLNNSLRRSESMDGNHPQHIRLLETLNIFALRADYMTKFKESLEREGVDTSIGRRAKIFLTPTEECRVTKAPRVPRTVDDLPEVEFRQCPQCGYAASGAGAGRHCTMCGEALQMPPSWALCACGALAIHGNTCGAHSHLGPAAT